MQVKTKCCIDRRVTTNSSHVIHLLLMPLLNILSIIIWSEKQLTMKNSHYSILEHKVTSSYSCLSNQTKKHLLYFSHLSYQMLAILSE